MRVCVCVCCCFTGRRVCAEHIIKCVRESEEYNGLIFGHIPSRFGYLALKQVRCGHWFAHCTSTAFGVAPLYCSFVPTYKLSIPMACRQKWWINPTQIIQAKNCADIEVCKAFVRTEVMTALERIFGGELIAHQTLYTLCSTMPAVAVHNAQLWVQCKLYTHKNHIFWGVKHIMC